MNHFKSNFGALSVGAFAVLLLWVASSPFAEAGTQVTFAGSSGASTSLSGTSGYPGGTRPTNTSDVLLGTTATALTISAATATMESLSLTNGQTDTISNSTTTSTNSTLTLGNGAGFNNANDSNASNELFYIDGSSTLIIQGTNSSTGSGTLGLTLASSGNFNVGSGSTLEVDAAITSSTGITKTGAGTLILGGNNTAFVGTFSASAGLVNLNANGALGAATSVAISGTGTDIQSNANGFTNLINDAATVSISGTGILDLRGGAETVGSLTGTNNAILKIGDYTGTNGSGSFTVGDSTTTTTFAGVISGTRATAGPIFTKQGSGTLVLSGANTYTGITAVNAGTLAATLLTNGGSASGIGASSNAAANLLLGPGAILQYTGTATSSDRLFTINGTATGAAATLDASGAGALNLTNTGSIAYGTTNQTRTLMLTGTNAGANTLAAAIADNGTSKTTLTKNGVGTWVVSGTNTFTGGVNLNLGMLNVGSNSAIGSTGTISFGGGTLQFSSSNTTDYSSRFSGGTNQLFSIDTNGQNVSFGTLLKGSGSTLTKLGSGTLTLTSTGTSSAYTGGTAITGGKLLFTGTLGTPVGTGPISIGAAGTLASGSGTTSTVPGLVTTAAMTSVIAPGATAAANTGTVGALTLSGGLNIAAGATIPFDIGDSNNTDLIKITGGTFTGGTANASVTFNFNNLGVTDQTQYALIDFTGATASGVDLTDFTSTGVGGTFVFNGTELDFIAAVPEPTTLLGGALLVVALGWNQRRRLGGLAGLPPKAQAA